MAFAVAWIVSAPGVTHYCVTRAEVERWKSHYAAIRRPVVVEEIKVGYGPTRVPGARS